ncbi:MAG: hypothetical protein ACFFHV_20755 [Promethearchaeota archaeon]
MLACKVLRIGSDKEVETQLNSFLSSMKLDIEDIKISHSVFKGRLLVTIIYNVK